MHVAGQHHVVPRRARVAEDVEDDLCCTAMSHPVFGIHQQRVTQPAEQLLHCLDQLHAKNRRRRHDDRRRVVQQCLLQLAQRLPVQQAGRLCQAAFAAPAAGAGVQHQQGWVGGQAELPALEAQQRADQLILGLVVQRLALLDQGLAALRVVTPGLAQQVAEQGIADDPPREGVAVGGFFPQRREVPVVGDVVVVEDHQARQVGHHSRYLAKVVGKRLDQRQFLEVTGLARGGKPIGHVQVHQLPGHW